MKGKKECNKMHNFRFLCFRSFFIISFLYFVFLLFSFWKMHVFNNFKPSGKLVHLKGRDSGCIFSTLYAFLLTLYLMWMNLMFIICALQSRFFFFLKNISGTVISAVYYYVCILCNVCILDYWMLSIKCAIN